MSVNVDLSGQTAVVTGAGRGIGRCMALTLGKAGAYVAAVARTQPDLEALKRDIENAGGTAGVQPCDVSDADAVTAMFERVVEERGRVDILVNNAGLGIYGLLQDMPPDDFDKVIAVNLRGTFLCAQQAMRIMRRQRRGTIVNVSSVLGFKGYKNQSAYTASKHGVMGLTKSLAVEAQPHGIRVSAVLPGGVDTEMVRKSRPDLDPEDLLRPVDVAQAVMYLLSLSEHAAVDEIYIRRRNSKPF